MTSKFKIDFVKYRKPTAAVSIALIVLSIASLIFRGLNFGIDFTGGYLIEVGYPRLVELTQIRKVLSDNGYGEAVVQHFGTSKDVLIRLAPRKGQEQAEKNEVTSAKISDSVLSILKAMDDGVEMRRVEFVGPQVGEDLKEEGGLAILMVLICILAYVAFRFEKRLSLGAVLALIHDVIITLGVLSVLQIGFDTTTLAALLAVIGYSLNDTIVVYDRIRENFRKMRKGTPIDIANASINETLSRTLMTSGTTLLVLFALFGLGGEIIHSFSLALIIGIVVGTYSSIYIASASALTMGMSRDDLMLVKKEGAEFDIAP